MSKGVKTVKVDDVEYELTQLGGVEGLDLFDRLTEKLGPALADAIRALFKSGKIDDETSQAGLAFMLAEAMVVLPADFKMQLRIRFAGLSKVNLAGTILDLGDGKTLERGGVFDQHFAGRFGHMTKWLLAAMKWSFEDFLPSSKKSAAPAEAPTA